MLFKFDTNYNPSPPPDGLSTKEIITETKCQKKKQFNMIQGNAAISAGNYEGFLALCINDTVWEFVGDRTIGGK